MATLKASSNEKTIGKWKSIEGHQVLMLSAGSIGEAIEQLTDLPENITKGRGFVQGKFRIQVDFTDKKGEAKALVPREDGARRSPEAPPFDPRAKGLELVEKAKAAEGGYWSGEKLREIFKLTPSTLHRKRKEHRIVFWRDARHAFFYPKWQFTDGGSLLPGIEEVLGAFKSSDEWRIMRYFLTPRHQLGEKRPLDLLRAGEVEKVVPHAHAHAAEGSW